MEIEPRGSSGQRLLTNTCVTLISGHWPFSCPDLVLLGYHLSTYSSQRHRHSVISPLKVKQTNKPFESNVLYFTEIFKIRSVFGIKIHSFIKIYVKTCNNYIIITKCTRNWQTLSHSLSYEQMVGKMGYSKGKYRK